MPPTISIETYTQTVNIYVVGEFTTPQDTPPEFFL
jgi:hypothetical protein